MNHDDPGKHSNVPKRRVPSSRMLLPAILLFSASAVFPGEPMRTGMVEAGLRMWRVARTDRADNTVDQTLVGLSCSRFLNDNITLGFEVGAFLDGTPSDSLVVDIRSRLYWFPLSRFTPWTELRGGGAMGLHEGNALRLGGAIGLRWVPDLWNGCLAVDLQLVGFERWKQDWSAEYVEEDQPSSRVDLSMVRSPWTSAESGTFGHASPLSWPVFGVSLLF